MSDQLEPAIDRLTSAIAALRTEGRAPECAMPGAAELRLAQHPGDRAIAASWCVACPLIELCGQAADEEGFDYGVWGGKDYTRAPAITHPRISV